jgi:5-methyltetrahydrofolate--homocysteine methyltransferase
MSEFTALTAAIIKGNRVEAKKQTQLLLDEGVKPDAIVDKGLVPGMAVVGERFKCNEAFVPEMLIAARAMKESMLLLEPLLVKAGVTPKYKAVIGTVQGDLHDIGKNLVAMMLKGANIGVVDLGTNVPAATFIAAAKEHHADVIGLSALLTTTMPAMRETVETVKKDAGLGNVKVIIGGAPISQIFADEIGADGFAPDAASAVDEVLRVVAAIGR